MSKEYARILIFEVNWLGDVLFSVPFIRAMRKRFKNAHIACAVAPRAGDILRNNPYIDEIIIYDEKSAHKGLFGKWRFVSLLRKKRFDLAVLLHRSLSRALLVFFARIGERSGYRTQKGRRFLTRPIEPPESEMHKVEYFLKIAETFGCDTSGKDYEFFVRDEDRKYIDRELSDAGIAKEGLLVVINPGGNWPPKRWREENFAELSNELTKKYNAKIVISGSDKDKGRAERIKNNMKEKPVILCGRTNLKQLGALMERSDFVISGDSGPMHIAVAVKTNVMALFGPTSPGLTGPYGGKNYRVVRKITGCEIPCYDLACRDYRCMDAITVGDVLAAFGEMYRTSLRHKT